MIHIFFCILRIVGILILAWILLSMIKLQFKLKKRVEELSYKTDLLKRELMSKEQILKRR